MASLEFKWDHPHPDRPEIVFRLYEQFGTEPEVMVEDNIGEPNFSLIIPDDKEGTFTYRVTSFDTRIRKESAKSNAQTVSLVAPQAPTNFTVTLSS